MKALLGGILIAIGILVAGASGLCALIALGLQSPPQYAGVITFFLPPVLIGLGLIVGGRALITSARRDDGAGQ